MSILVPLIFTIFILSSIVKTVQRANGDNKNTEQNQTNQTNGPVYQNHPIQQIRPAQQVNQTQQNRPSSQKVSMQQNREEAGSTTEYLRQKAKEDELQHRREKMQEQQKMSYNRDGRVPALRYMEGDNIPNGLMLVRCGYCGADNLTRCNTGQKYTCYFCRENI